MHEKQPAKTNFSLLMFGCSLNHTKKIPVSLENCINVYVKPQVPVTRPINDQEIIYDKKLQLYEIGR